MHGRLDALERDLRARVDDLAAELRDRLETLDAELGARVDALNAGREASEDLDRVLATVPGVGPVRRQALIAAFGDLGRLRRAPREELEIHGGLPPALAARIQEQLAAESARPSDGGPADGTWNTGRAGLLDSAATARPPVGAGWP